jgi:hypothetical protein
VTESLPLLVFLVLAGVLLVGVTVWVVRPLLGGAVMLDPPDPRAVALLSRREAILASLRDLDSDHTEGRLGDADHAALRQELVAQGVATLAALDRLAEASAGRTAELAAAVEAEVAAVEAGDG